MLLIRDILGSFRRRRQPKRMNIYVTDEMDVNISMHAYDTVH